MNTALLKITAGLGLALSLGLASCTETSLVTPDKPMAASSASPNDIISPNLPQKHTLTKYGDATLTYYADGRLKRVMYGPDVRGSLAVRQDYTYPTGQIKVITSSGNELLREETFWLDANTGRCYQSKAIKYTGDPLASIVNLYYTYNAKGQLAGCQSKDITGWTDYTYTADGDLSKAIDYSAFGVAILETTFNYDAAFGDPVLPDLYPLNSEWTRLTDRYLKIFGKPGKHLVKLVTVKSLPGKEIKKNRLYTYTLNADGYVTVRKEFDFPSAILIETKAYDYQVTDIGFQF